jgi:hypothetical protein
MEMKFKSWIGGSINIGDSSLNGEFLNLKREGWSIPLFSKLIRSRPQRIAKPLEKPMANCYNFTRIPTSFQQ